MSEKGFDDVNDDDDDDWSDEDNDSLPPDFGEDAQILEMDKERQFNKLKT